mgnify:CR=1 FL=1
MSHHLAFVLQARRADRSDSVAGDSHEFVTAHLRGEILFDDGESGLLFLDEIRTIAGTERIDTLVPSPRFARSPACGRATSASPSNAPTAPPT